MPNPPVGTRICVVGTSGSGKTFVARALAERLGLRYICNDEIIWRANWMPTPREERLGLMDDVTRTAGWTFDGNLGSSEDDQLVLSRCDTIVWLDLPRAAVMWQITRRTIGRALTREQLWHGNVERWSKVLSCDSMILWAARTYSRRRREYAALFADARFADRERIRLRSRAEVNRWLESVGGSSE